MGAAVAEAHQRVRVPQHLAHRVERAFGIVADGPVEQRLPVALQQVVVGDVLGRAPLAGGDGGDAPLGGRLVVRRRAERVEPVPAADALGDERVRALLGEEAGAERGLPQRLELLLERQMGDRLPARPAGEGVHRNLEAEQDSGGAGQCLADHRKARTVRLGDMVEKTAPAIRPVVVLEDGDGNRPPAALDHAAQHGELLVEIVEIGDHLQPTGSDPAHRNADGTQLVLRRRQSRDRAAVQRLVIERARGGEAERAGANARRCKRRHGRVVFVGRGLALHAPLAHDEDPHRRMRHLRRDVEVVGPGVERVHVLLEALPGPRQPFVQHRAGNVLDALHELHQRLPLVGPARREADAAIADHRGGDAVPGRGRDPAAPGGLRVVMGVGVDKAGRHDHAARIDLLVAGTDIGPDRRNQTA